MSVVFTVGYEGTDIDRFVATLAAAGVSRLADVRAVPISRKKGFSKSKLCERLSSEGIEYRHFSQLGDPKPGRDAARAGAFDEFRRIYSSHLATDDAQSQLSDLAVFVAEEPTALLCFERAPAECHRSMVADSLNKSIGFEVFNLFADDPQRYVRNAEKLPKFKPCRLAAE